MPTTNHRRSNPKAVVVVPDVHFGEHDEAAVEVATKAIEAIRPGRVVQLGDLLDCMPFSSHLPHKINLAKEYDFYGLEVKPARRWIARVAQATQRVIILEGNHEYRAERWCMGAGSAGTALWDTLNPKNVLLGDYDRKHCEYIPYIGDRDVTSRYHITKDLIAVHGWGEGTHASSAHLTKASVGGWSVVHGHTHRIQLDSMRCPRSDRPIKAWSPGCLRTFIPQYTQANGPTRWNHGISVVYVGKKSWTEYICTIVKGATVLPDGREIRA